MTDLDPGAQPFPPDELSCGAGPSPTPSPERVGASIGKMPPARRAPRHNQWTRAKMVAFLRELAASQSVAQAARSVGMSRQSAYRLRNQLVGTPFSLAWEVALEAGLQQLAHAMLDRAVNGVEVPHYYHGELVGTSRQFDERLAIWIAGNQWKLGRQQVAREFSAEGWDNLLERIEMDGLDWHEGDHQPGRHWPLDDPKLVEELEGAFQGRSRYVAEVQHAERRRGRAKT